jgi:hypothetical protein
MERQQAIAKIITDSVEQQTAAYESLAESKIKLSQARGETSGTDADQRLQTAKRDAEKQKEFEEETAKKAEAKAKHERSASAAAESVAAMDKTHKMEPDLAVSDAAVITQEYRVKKLQEAAADLRKAATESDAEYKAGGMGSDAARYLAKEKADKAADDAESLAEQQGQHLGDLKRENKELNRQAESLAKLADERDATARKLKEEAEAIDDSIKLAREANTKKHAIENQIDRVTQATREDENFKKLSQKQNRTPEEQRELDDLTRRRDEASRATTRGQQASETHDVMGAANTALNNAARGRGSQAEIHAVLQRIIGHQEADVRETEETKRQMEQLHRRLDDLDHRMTHNASPG